MRAAPPCYTYSKQIQICFVKYNINYGHILHFTDIIYFSMLLSTIFCELSFYLTFCFVSTTPKPLNKLICYTITRQVLRQTAYFSRNNILNVYFSSTQSLPVSFAEMNDFQIKVVTHGAPTADKGVARRHLAGYRDTQNNCHLVKECKQYNSVFTFFSLT